MIVTVFKLFCSASVDKNEEFRVIWNLPTDFRPIYLESLISTIFTRGVTPEEANITSINS